MGKQMPKIELVLPGEHRKSVVAVADTYRITIERMDGIACSEVEAATAASAFFMQRLQKPKRKTD